MKTIMNKVVIWVMIAVLFTACSDDYLDTAPTSSTGTATAFETTDNASMVINGICRIMTRQYGSYGQGFNGEGTVKMYYGNYQGTAFVYPATGWTNTVTGSYHDSNSATYTAYPWYYYYQIASGANSVLFYINDAQGTDSEKQRIKAQALTFRAYAYTMLIQLYGYRWQDSNNGTTPGIILRLEPTSESLPLSTVGETYDQIYKDLNEAISLFGESNWTRDSKDVWSPNINVAYATFARAAINKLDYSKAIEMSVKAREGYPLMTNAEYLSGFCDPNQEWIWGSYGGTTETLYFYSYHAYIAYNSNAGAVKNQPKCINREYYDKIPETDVRRRLFLDPSDCSYSATNLGYSTTNGQAVGSAGSTSGASEAGNRNEGLLTKKARAAFPTIDVAGLIFAWMQFKVSCTEAPGVGYLNHFRSSEMYLIEAEAQYKTGNEDRARQLLVELTKNSGRNPEYSCTQSGENLFNEIKFVAQIELWGEGFDWFMMKRWNDKIIHHSFANGGNYVSAYNGEIGPEEKNKQTWVIPLKETDYNPLAK
ncbi:MAG: RagB/SusD family nutrient uptake outer membrane protein [Dysgonamonadaceae bacterium]|jgi:hypothetical protein|nr:RagB/SusD family nutrient uptake outer membrane protein [Dysgonamonadaceae bacterium]